MSGLQATDQARRVDAVIRQPAPPTGRAWVSRAWLVHLPFALLLLLAVVPRAVALWGFRPVLMFFGDSQTYLITAQNGELTNARPYGYSTFLRLMSWTDHIWLVPLVQHVAILVLAIVIYVTLLRLKAPVWLAFIVPAPMLLDGYQVLIEHVALTEVMFTCLVMAALLLVVRRRLSIPTAATAGLLLAMASMTRTVAMPLIVLLVAYLIVRRVGWRAVTACVVAFSIPLLAYAAWFASVFGSFALQQDGRFLYARVAPIADCAQLSLSDEARSLCDGTPVELRQGSNYYAWDRGSPFNRPVKDADAATARDAAGREFGIAVITGQPLDYSRMVARDFIHYFAPGRTADFRDTPPSWWNFPLTPERDNQQIVLSGTGFINDKTDVALEPGAAAFLRSWQSVMGTQGLFLMLCLLLALAGSVVGRGRLGGARRFDPLLFAGTGTALLLVPSATSVFDYRYALPAAVCLYAAGGWGVLLLLQARALAKKPEADDGRAAAERASGTLRRHRSRSRVRPFVGGVLIGVVILGVVLAPIEPEPIYQRYVRAGAERGALGYSLDSVQPLADRPSWMIRNFDGGSIYADPAKETYVVTKQALVAYRAQGGYDEFGLPVTGTSLVRRSGGEFATWFESGAIIYSPVRGARSVLPPFLDAWCDPGELCRIGVPLADAETLADGTLVQEFVGGRLVQRPGGSVQQELTVIGRNDGDADAPTDAVQPPDVRGD